MDFLQGGAQRVLYPSVHFSLSDLRASSASIFRTIAIRRSELNFFRLRSASSRIYVLSWITGRSRLLDIQFVKRNSEHATVARMGGSTSSDVDKQCGVIDSEKLYFVRESGSVGH